MARVSATVLLKRQESKERKSLGLLGQIVQSGGGSGRRADAPGIGVHWCEVVPCIYGQPADKAGVIVPPRLRLQRVHPPLAARGMAKGMFLQRGCQPCQLL